METQQIAQLLTQTLSPDGNVVRSATDALHRLSILPSFPFSLLSISTGSEDPGQRIAAATYLKNFTRRNIPSSKISKEFRDALVRALLRVDSAVLKVLVEAFRAIVAAEFVKENLWPDLVPELQAVIQNSDLINKSGNCEWKTINALTVLQSLIRPFQYFLNPKVAKEPVPQQLELIAQDILVPLLDVFHQCVERALSICGKREEETEKLLLIFCKCIYFAVRSHMPSALAPHLSSFCWELFGILNSLSFDGAFTWEDGYLLRLKTGKRSLLIFCALVTRHRKLSDKLMPNIINCVSKIVKHSTYISKLDFLPERIVSLAFDVISHVLETGPGWRLVSPHFSSLLNSAIFPALVMNEKDTTEWEEDAEEYMRKNLPSELDEISGWKEDLFTARKSALNLLGVISMSKGPPVGGSGYNSSLSSKRKKGDKTRGKDRSSMGELLVLPFLSKFPIPSDVKAHEAKILNEYYGVLMAYGSLQDFLSEQRAEYTATLVRMRVLPLYKISTPVPYLLASANWVLGELASCLPEELSTDVYSSLLKALTMPDMEDISCYPVRVSAAGAITELVENDYLPPEWLPLLQVVVGQIADESEETSILFQLLGTLVEAGNEHVALHIPYIISSLVGTISKCIPPTPEPWPPMVEQGFAALAIMAQCWEYSMPEEGEQKESSEVWVSGRVTIVIALSTLLQQAWLRSAELMEGKAAPLLPPPSCVDDSSALLRFIMQSVTKSNEVLNLKISELLLVWADLIANWHAWEEAEDLSIFNCIKEIVSLHQKLMLQNFVVGEMPYPPAPPVARRSIIEGIGAFVCEAFSQYPSATWRASSCVHLLLHVPTYTIEAEGARQSLVIAFSHAAFSCFRDIRSDPCSLWKPLLLAVSSCYLCCPDVVEKILEKDEHEGFAVWASALALISSSTFEHGLSSESELKLSVLTLAKVVERLLMLEIQRTNLLQKCFMSLMEASVSLREAQGEEEDDDEESGDDQDAGDEETDDDDEDSDDDEREETEEEFLDRYAKAAVSLENGTVVEEGDVEEQEQVLELGGLEEVDQQSVVLSLIQRYHQVLLQGHSLPPQVISCFLVHLP
ncbi:LOW QUALITY PROTEIN: importin beta-like SAD2 homolog [Actinidia eriantha]|uniref:LOW QUALITY PROTEIN: importin beta-like SAD2 homolog n=1 Tax=Actinidia eriantha TaxID=165200 RepID=UPI002588E512|nr:LOW QUALITY PROTEIN: importin beta-like SAD2 homolog [Actinidia eriantha]